MIGGYYYYVRLEKSYFVSMLYIKVCEGTAERN